MLWCKLVQATRGRDKPDDACQQRSQLSVVSEGGGGARALGRVQFARMRGRLRGVGAAHHAYIRGRSCRFGAAALLDLPSCSVLLSVHRGPSVCPGVPGRK